MIFETFDATYLNYILNKPSIKNSFGLPIEIDALDCSSLASDPCYKIITNGLDAFIIAEQTSPLLFSLHLVFDETCRGKRALLEGKRLVQWFWDNTQAIMLYGAIPVDNLKSRMICRLFGCKSDGRSILNSPLGSFEAEWFHYARPSEALR